MTIYNFHNQKEKQEALRTLKKGHDVFGFYKGRLYQVNGNWSGEGHCYDVYDSSNILESDIESIDGGMCTGMPRDAVEMALASSG